VDALVTFVISQTGQNFADSQASRFTTIAAYNKSVPADVQVTAAEGKKLFETSGCYSCHYIGDPNRAHVTGDPRFGKGGIVGPELSWEGARHSKQWLLAHYANPQAFVPGSIMPIFPFSNSQRAALSLYDAAQMPDAPGARPVSPDQDLTTDQQTKLGEQNNEIRYMTR
jgi:cbb3-type cytochrome oxidase cytochrome c subunit